MLTGARWGGADHLLGIAILSTPPPGNSVVFSPDRHTLAIANADQTVQLWNVIDPPHHYGPTPRRPRAVDPLGGVQPRRRNPGHRQRRRDHPPMDSEC